MYRMTAEVRDAQGRLLDQQSDTFGIRTIEIRDRHLLLNGERVRLTGVARHEDSVSEGLAETTGTMRYDWDDMKSLQVSLTRPVHYPQNPFILDYADRHGILLIPEIPLWQFSEAQLKNPQALPQNLGMGFAYWDPAGVNIPRLTGGWFNGGTGLPDAIYVWNGLTIFDNADAAGNTNVNAPNYSVPQPALDALGGR